jgi:hypothetical protein
VFTERQSFSAPELPSADRRGAHIAVSDWLTGRLRWTASAGVDAWSPQGARARLGGGVQVTKFADRLDVVIDTAGWPGRDPFGTFAAGVRARSSTARQSVVLLGTADLQLATRLTPLDLWWAGDTGHARAALLRAHPALDGGRLRADRLGRTLGIVSLEAQRWWTVSGRRPQCLQTLRTQLSDMRDGRCVTSIWASVPASLSPGFPACSTRAWRRDSPMAQRLSR